MPNPVVHFEIPVDNPDRAKQFYESLFGWKITFMPDYDYYMVEAKDGDVGINGGMMKRKMPEQAVTNYVTVKDIDATLKAAEAKGAKIIMPRHPIGGGAIAIFLDPEGNPVGLHEDVKPTAQK
jgi:uncharacterized protein